MSSFFYVTYYLATQTLHIKCDLPEDEYVDYKKNIFIRNPRTKNVPAIVYSAEALGGIHEQIFG